MQAPEFPGRRLKKVNTQLIRKMEIVSEEDKTTTEAESTVPSSLNSQM